MVSATTTRSSSNNNKKSENEGSIGVSKMIELIKEIVGDHNHSDADIHSALKDSGMEPNEAAQILLNQDPFREVKRKRDKKKKENIAYIGSTDSKKPPEKPTTTSQVMKPPLENPTTTAQVSKSPAEKPTTTQATRPPLEKPTPTQVTKPRYFPQRNSRLQGGKFQRRVGVYSRNTLPVVSREFRVVRDNRINQLTNKDLKSDSHVTTFAVQKVAPKMSRKGSSTGTLNNQDLSLKGSSVSHPRQARVADKRAADRKNGRDGKGPADQNAVSQVQADMTEIPEMPAATMSSNSSAVGVYSSSTDPIHVPSPDSRKLSAIRAIKREVGVVGGRRQSTGNNRTSSFTSSSPENPPVCSAESFRPFPGMPKSDQVRQSTVTESVVPTTQSNRSYQNNHYSNKQHQQSLGHQKASQPNKEWRPKSSHKSSSTSPGIIGSPAKSTALRTDNPNGVEGEAAKIKDKLSQMNTYENRNVVIPDHIRVPETDRCRLTFGSFGTNSDSSTASLSGTQTVRADRTVGESTTSLSIPALESSPDDQVTNSTSDFPDLNVVHENQLPEKKELPSPENIEHYSEIGLVQENSSSIAPVDSQQQQEHPELSNFAAYDPQGGYDIPYFRQTMDGNVRVTDLQSPQESTSSHNPNSIPASTVAMMQQQQTPVAQMYPQLHVSHFANVLPYRQFVSPVYVPPMAMPGYSTNPPYPHPSTGSSYVLMPGGSSHLGGSGLKYGMQQYKPVPTGNPTGYGNFVNPTAYAMNAPHVVSSGAALEDSSRIKYKDGNIYIPSPQAETSEVWVQNQPREFPGLQSNPYYNMPGQTPHAAAYMQSHNGHASFNAAAAAAQSSHLQFPGVYHTPQPAAMPSPHHLGPAIGSNVQVGVAPAAPGGPVGAYQQPQPGLSWTTNFGGM